MQKVISLVTYAVVTAVVPGPNNIMSMSNASRLGFKKTFPFTLGLLAGMAGVMMLCTLFCSTLSSLIPKIKLPMMIIGAAYILYLAWKRLRAGSSIREDHSRSGFLSGMLFQYVNPKLYLCGIISIQSYALPLCGDNVPLLILTALYFAVNGFFFSLLWALFGSVFKQLFEKHAKLINTIMALLLVYCAFSLLFK